MEIINTEQFLSFNSSLALLTISEKLPQEVLDELDPMFDDPDAAYSYWVKCDVFEKDDLFSKKALIKHMLAANKVQLDLTKQGGQPFSSNILTQHSIQISLFEGLIMHELMSANEMESWGLKSEPLAHDITNFRLSSQKVSYDIFVNERESKVVVKKNKNGIGVLSLDIEKQVIEKIYGTLNSDQFIIDPIWKNSQTTVDSVKLVIGNQTTEIVHHPKHKKTLWHGLKGAKIMAITTNKTFQINKNLYLNKKRLEWPKKIIESLQWYSPYQRLAIDGAYKIKNK